MDVEYKSRRCKIYFGDIYEAADSIRFKAEKC